MPGWTTSVGPLFRVLMVGGAIVIGILFATIFDVSVGIVAGIAFALVIAGALIFVSRASQGRLR